MSRRKHDTKSRRRWKANMVVDGDGGEFIKARLSGDHVTLVVEGRDQDGPSVSGIGIDLPGIDKLIKRLTNLRDALARRLAKGLDTSQGTTQDGSQMHRP